jgi:hypothetical protein
VSCIEIVLVKEDLEAAADDLEQGLLLLLDMKNTMPKDRRDNLTDLDIAMERLVSARIALRGEIDGAKPASPNTHGGNPA